MNVELKEIATKIVKKCKGLPLALKSVGSLLHTKSSVSEWENVLLSDIWDLPIGDSGIIPALFLSYRHLPSHLKRCFAFCALFPKDYEFDKDELILLWKLENFLQCPQTSKSPEEVGELYFNNLFSRSFFQQSCASGSRFVMHDLLHDLARYVCGDIYISLEVDKAKGISKFTRHVLFTSDDVDKYDSFWTSIDAKRLRTFVDPSRWKYCDCHWESNTIHDLVSKFKFLRILSLCGCLSLGKVPEFVGELKYLCSLDLSGIDINKLPDSTCSLYNLQILKLNCCIFLEELPSDLHKLTNLRCLEWVGTRVRSTPMLLGKLKNLQVLSSFCVGMSSELSIQQLGGLNLHGGLKIQELQNIVNPMEALAADFKNKTNLVRLDLQWYSNNIPGDQRKDREVLENLQPSKHLKELSIWNYGGAQLPSWLSNNSLSNVVSLNLRECKYCLCLPSLGLLPSLKELKIEGFDQIVRIGAEFYGNSSSPFPSLEKLHFIDMNEWEDWECKVVFPRLQTLYLYWCPKLKVLSERLLHVKDLSIRFCERISISGPSLEALSLETIEHSVSNTSVEEFSIFSCNSLNFITKLCYDFLETLAIDCSCDSLLTFPLDFFPKLCSLELRECHNLRMISQEQTHNHLKILQILDCPQFESLPKRMHILLPSLTSITICDCPKVEMFSDGGFPSNVQNIFLSYCSKLTSSLKWTSGVNTCLESLYIEGVDAVESFPEEGFLPLSLTSLVINDFPNLKKLDYKGLCHLSSLKVLKLWHCSNLECLPEEGLPKSISTLDIKDCGLLAESCWAWELRGQDWEKITHIQRVNIS